MEMKDACADGKAAEESSRGTAARWPVVAALAGLLVVAYLLRFILIPFVLAGAMAYVLSPVVGAIQARLRFPRALAAVAAWAMLVGALLLAGWAASRTLVPQVMELTSRLPEALHGFLVKVLGTEHARFMGQEIDVEELARQIAEGATGAFGGMEAGAMQAAGVAISIILSGVLTLVLLLYYLISTQRLKRGVLWLVPPHHRPRAQAVARRMDPVLGRYIVGLMVMASYAFCVVWVVAKLVVGLRYATVLALAVGLLEVILVIGPAASTVLLSIIALQQGSVGSFLVMAGMLTFLRLSIDELIGPVVLGRAVALHPVVVILAILVGATLFGLLGVLLAVPAAAAIKVALEISYAEETPAEAATQSRS